MVKMIKNWTHENCEDFIIRYDYDDAVAGGFEDEYIDASEFVRMVNYDLREGIIQSLDAYDAKGGAA